MPKINFEMYQRKFEEWEEYNFGELKASTTPACAMTGVIEELGELAHAFLKGYQKIREGTDEKVAVNLMMDAIGDMMVYLISLHTSLNLRLAHTFDVAQNYLVYHHKLARSFNKAMLIGRMCRALGRADEEIETWQARSYDKGSFVQSNVVDSLANFVAHAVMFCQACERDFNVEVIVVYDKVLLRDWRKDNKEGGEKETDKA